MTTTPMGWWSAEGFNLTHSAAKALRDQLDELPKLLAEGKAVVVIDGVTLRWHPAIDPQDHWRLVRVATDMLSQFGTRTERGERITAEWGEPDEAGVYELTFTVHTDDRLCDETPPRDLGGDA